MTNDSCDLAVQGLQVVRQEILSRISHLQKCLETTDELLAMFGNRNGKSAAPDLESPKSVPSPIDSPYASMKTQGAVERFLQEREGRWFGSGEVAKELLRLGLPHAGKAYMSTVAGALNRAVQKRLVIRVKRSGVFAYTWAVEGMEYIEEMQEREPESQKESRPYGSERPNC